MSSSRPRSSDVLTGEQGQSSRQSSWDRSNTQAGGQLGFEMLLSQFNIDPSPEPLALSQLQTDLDEQSLQQVLSARYTFPKSPPASVNTTVDVVLKLSAPLSHANYTGNFVFQELQIRALISALGLLHRLKVSSIDPDQWDTIHRNISATFQRITNQRPTSLEERSHHGCALYLLQLASMYMSFITRGSTVPAVVSIVSKIFFGAISVASGQYGNTSQIPDGVMDLIRLWQTPQKKYQALVALQELTRLAISLCRSEDNDANHNTSSKEAASLLVRTLYDRIYEILEQESASSLPTRPQIWPRILTTINLGPPAINRGYFLVGLLDCTAQLSALTGTQNMGIGLKEHLRQLIWSSQDQEYRWKAIEVFLSCRSTRENERDFLIAEAETRSNDPLADNNNRATLSITRKFDQMEVNDLRYVPQEILSSSRADVSVDEVPTQSRSISVSADYDWREGPLPAANIELKPDCLTIPFPHDSRLSRHPSYDKAGLSVDCRHAYFSNESRVSVFKLDCFRRTASLVLDLRKDLLHGDKVKDVSIHSSFVVVLTFKRLLTLRITDRKLIYSMNHSGWDTGGLVSDENENQLTIYVGYHQSNDPEKPSGQIRILQSQAGQQSRIMISQIGFIDFKDGDYPKGLSLSPDSRLLVCITKRNAILAWHLQNGTPPSVGRAFLSNKHTTTQEIKETGITSAHVFSLPRPEPTPDPHYYVFCTTAPSGERWRHNGEWSFILPIPPPDQLHLTPPAKVIHDLTQFEEHGAFRAGCSSLQHGICAVLEKNGCMSVLPLEAKPAGGIGGADLGLQQSGVGLCRSENSWENSIRFNDQGQLIAVDKKGKVVTIDFEESRGPEE